MYPLDGAQLLFNIQLAELLVYKSSLLETNVYGMFAYNEQKRSAFLLAIKNPFVLLNIQQKAEKTQTTLS
jgi:hypothetical protein